MEVNMDVEMEVDEPEPPVLQPPPPPPPPKDASAVSQVYKCSLLTFSLFTD